MSANHQIETFFAARKAEGRTDSIALDATVAHFSKFNSMYVRTHIRHCALWGAQPQYLGTDNDGLACYQLPFQL